MKNIIILISSIILISCISQKKKDSYVEIVNDYKDAINTNDYNIIKPHLSNSLKAENMDYISTWLQFYSYINYTGNKKLNAIQIDSTQYISDSTLVLFSTEIYKDKTKKPLKLNLLRKNNAWKIYKANSFTPIDFTLITRASFTVEEIIGNSPRENIINLKVFDKLNYDSTTNIGYTVYYDSENHLKYVDLINSHLKVLDSLLLSQYKFKSINKDDFLVTNNNSNNVVTVGESSDIPWVISLPDGNSTNSIYLTEKMATTYSHEIIEGTLVDTYNLSNVKFRWFRDGLSEYLAYKFSLKIAPRSASSYFMHNRLDDYKLNKQDGHLLDWRGRAPNKVDDVGNLYGSKYIYENKNGQYGRAFMFFKKTFQENEEQLVNILASIYKEKQDMNIEKLLEIMSEELNTDVIQLLSNF